MNDEFPDLVPHSVVVDCDRCVVRSPGACGDCVVTAMLGTVPADLSFDTEEMAALDALADSGLVAPLRLVLPIATRSHTRSDRAS